MIKAAQIAEILSLYKKHGWILRRVLLSDELQKNLGDAPATLFGAAEIRESVIVRVVFASAEYRAGNLGTAPSECNAVCAARNFRRG